jgi:hypothetical protein
MGSGTPVGGAAGWVQDFPKSRLCKIPVALGGFLAGLLIFLTMDVAFCHVIID